ncbi:hypothetical protein D9758_012600 [Tetrapyrgos nigripes]|uniref:Uncharacterized protein n=1 Tax=Tetrapyrgos nigripes TaxID=182062 RepID=A0A8H5GDT4_9AGAR|nr:hypothetical protein D9758_012600 [Tetrapyrgos nigripes]
MATTDEEQNAGEKEQHVHELGSKISTLGKTLTRRLLTWGIETRGILPVSPEERTDDQFFKIFFLWFSTNFNILSFSAGTLGPVAFGLSTRDSCLVILLFNMLCCIPPAYFSTWGPKLGLRQMVQACFSFGYYGVIIPCVLNLINMFGFCILNSILGGQTLASVTDGNLSWTYRSAATPFSTGKSIIIQCKQLSDVSSTRPGGKHLSTTAPLEPATAVSVLSYASTIAGFVITYASLASDFTSYYRPEVSSWKIALYSYFGFFLPITTLQCLGAAVASSAPLVPSWSQGYNLGGHSNIDGLLEAMLRPVGNFGKLLTVLLSLSVTGNIAATFYSISLNIQLFIPMFVRVPRYVFSLVATAIVLPLAIVGSHRFYDTLENFLALIGYWASDYITIILVEHFVYRRRNLVYSTTMGYDLSQWNRPRQLPTGIPALLAGVLSFGLIIPCMSQVLYEGPIGERTGDIGFEVGFFLCGVLYLVLRSVESVSPTNTPAPTSTTLPPSDSKTNAVNLSSHYIPVTVSVKTSYSLRQLHVQPWSNPTAKRNRKLAEALGINVSLGNSGGSGFGNVVYNGELVAFGMVNANFWGLWRGLSQTSSRCQRSRNIFTQLLPHNGSDWKFDVREIKTKRPIHPPHRHTSQYSNPPPYPSTSTSPTCDWDHHSYRTTSSLGKLADPRGESITPSSSLAAAASSASLWKPCN